MGQRGGTRVFVMTASEFLARLAAAVPHPREHQLTYQGVLAPAPPLRDQVVPRPVVPRELAGIEATDAEGSECSGKHSKDQLSSFNCTAPWAELLS